MSIGQGESAFAVPHIKFYYFSGSQLLRGTAPYNVCVVPHVPHPHVPHFFAPHTPDGLYPKSTSIEPILSTDFFLFSLQTIH